MMRMSKKVSRAAVVSAIALSALALGSAAAFASGSFNVTAGSAASGTVVSYSAATTGTSPQVTFRDETFGFTLINCASASAGGTVTVVSGHDSNGLGTINGPGTVWNTCTGRTLPWTVTGLDTWGIDATGSTNASGVTPVRILGVSAHVTNGSCSFDVTGTVNGTYTNGATDGTLTLPGTTSTLTISNVSGGLCSQLLIINGNVVSFKATYKVNATTPSYNPIRINGTI